MPTIHHVHQEIESWLAAAVHDQLSDEERAAFQEHLAGCERCRALHQEETAMSHMIATTLDLAKPDYGFEQRIVSGFRRKIPNGIGMRMLLVRLTQSRAMRIASLAVLLALLALLGTWLTTSPTFGHEELAVAAAPPLGSMGDLRDNLGVIESSDSLRGREMRDRSKRLPETERVIVTGSYLPTAETRLAPGKQPAPARPKSAASVVNGSPEQPAEGVEFVEDSKQPLSRGNAPALTQLDRKLVRKAEVEIEVAKFDEAVPKIAALVADGKGYVATSSSEKQENGKLRGEVVVKILPQSLDGFLSALRALGEVKNQTLGTDDVTKNYFDTDARLNNSRIMEQRLVEMLQKTTGKVSDLLQVEKELGRVREQIEQMQGELKYLDAQVAFATVTITLSEKDMDAAAAFLLKRTGTLALFSAEVEKTFAAAKSALAGTKAKIATSSLDRDASGEVTAHLVLLLAPEEADPMIERIKGMGRVQSYKESSTRVAQGGSEASETARDKIDKVELDLTISRNAQEPALQTTSLGILTSNVSEKVARLKEDAAKEGAEIRSSSFNSNSNGYEQASITLRVPMKSYPALLKSFDQLGKVKDVNVRREDRGGAINETTAPAEIDISIYNEPSIVPDRGGLLATIRRTLTQGALALMWSLRMIGVAIAFLAPWLVAVAIVVWLLQRRGRARAKRDAAE